MNGTIFWLALACAAAPPVKTSKTPETFLYVRTTPAGAEILLEGKSLGTSPGLFKVAPGMRKIVIELDGYQPGDRQVTIKAGQVTRVVLRLEERPGPRAKSSKDPAAEVLKQFEAAANALDIQKLEALFLKPDDTPAGEARRKHLEEARKDWARMRSTGKRLRFRIALTEQKADGKDKLVTGAMTVGTAGRPGDAKEAAIPVRFRITPTDDGWKIAEMTTLEGERARQTDVVRAPGKPPVAPTIPGAEAGPRKVPPLSFHPVIEAVLKNPEARVAELLDLDTGRRATITEFGENDRATHRRIREEGVDVLGAIERLPGLLLFDVAVSEIPSAIWDTVTPDNIVNQWGLRQREPNPITPLAPLDVSKLPVTCMFETREGGMGVLQLIGLSEDGRGVKIRYKLVEPSVPGPDSARQQAVREVVQKFVAAAVKGDKTEAVNFVAGPPGRSAVTQQLDDVRETISAGLDPSQIRLVTIGRDRALVVTEFAQLNDPKYKNRVCMVYTLLKPDGRWVIDDIDLEDVEGLAGEIRRFDAEHGRRDAATSNLTDAAVVPTVSASARPVRTIYLAAEYVPGAEVVLDLATGQRLAKPTGEADPYDFTRMGKGDLFYDSALGCLRGARAMRWDGNRFVPLEIKGREEDAVTYRLPKVPCRLLITTAEQKHFDVTVLSVTKDGIKLEYRPADPSLVPTGAGGPPPKPDRKARVSEAGRTVPVNVTVTSNGQPVEGATVTFIPKAADGRSASGQTDAAGKAALTTVRRGDGAVPGVYGVTILKMVAPGAGSVPRHVLPLRFATPETSGLTVEVAGEGSNEFVFDLPGTVPTGPPSAQAPDASEKLLPATTRAFISITDPRQLADHWKRTELGQLMQDPVMQPLAEDVQKLLEHRLADLPQRLGLTLDDLKGVPGGELSLAFIQPAEGKTAVALLVDVTGHQAQAKALLEKVARNLTERGATQTEGTVLGIPVFIFTLAGGREGQFSQREEGPPPQAVYFLTNDLLGASDDLEVGHGILTRLAGRKGATLAELAAFQAVMDRCRKDAGGQAPQIRWFLKPFGLLNRFVEIRASGRPQTRWYLEPSGLAEAIRPAVPKGQPRYRRLADVLKSAGFGAVQGVGGFVDFAVDGYELLHRTVIYAPKPHEKSMKMLVFPNVGGCELPSWVPRDVAACTTFHGDVLNAFDQVGPIFNELVGDGEDGDLWQEVLEGLQRDPNGPQIDLREELFKHLDNQVTMITDYQLPISTSSERLLFAVGAKDPEAVAKAVEKTLKDDQQVRRRELEGHVIWETVPEGPAPEAATLEAPLLPNMAVTVAHGHLLVASHYDFLVKILKPIDEREWLGRAPDYLLIDEAIKRLGGGNDFLRRFSRTDAQYRPTYELIRQGKMPESRTVLGRILNTLFAVDSKGTLRQQQIDGSKLPEFEQVRRRLGPAGLFGTSEPDGWFLKGFTLSHDVEKRLADAKMISAASSAKSKLAESHLRTLETACQCYRLDTGDYPKTPQGLGVLIKPPSDLAEPHKWAGPYLRGDSIPRDPWGNPYRYERRHQDTVPRIWSAGPDGVSGTDDDIRGGSTVEGGNTR